MSRVLDIRRKVDPDGANFEIVTLNEVKEWLEMSSDENDNKIATLINQVVSAMEEYCAISLTPKLITLTGDFNYEELELPYGPVTSITLVKIRNGSDLAGAAQYDTHNATKYYVDGELFKRFKGNSCSRYIIDYKAAYPEDEIPEDLRLDIKRMVAYCYENRGDVPVSINESLELYAHAHRRMCWI